VFFFNRSDFRKKLCLSNSNKGQSVLVYIHCVVIVLIDIEKDQVSIPFCHIGYQEKQSKANLCYHVCWKSDIV